MARQAWCGKFGRVTVRCCPVRLGELRQVTMKQFMTTNFIASETGLSPDTIRKWVREMRKFIPERYDENTFFGCGKATLVRTVCLLDYSKYRTELQSPALRKHVPFFDALELERKLGIGDG